MKSTGIIIFGAAGSGKTTLGRAVAEKLNIPYYDIDDYIWRKDTAEPYTVMYSREEKAGRLMADISKYPHFVMGGSMSSFHEYFDPLFELAVHLSADVSIRVARANKRAVERFGARIKEGGDLYNHHLAFIDKISRYDTDGSPNLTEQTLWEESMNCEVLHLSGERPIEENAKIIAEKYGKIMKENEVKIEKATPDDAEALLAIYAPYVTDTAISFEYDVPTVEEFRKRIIDISSKYPYLKAVKNGEIVGYAYANTFKERAAYQYSVETTIYLKKDVRRMGIGSRLYEELEKSLRKIGILNMNACIAVTDEEDETLTNDSMYFHEKLGFRLVGRFTCSGMKFGSWYDMIWMEKLIGEHKKNPPSVKFGEM